MNPDPHEPDELSELFEQSAPAIDPLAHVRLRASAREIPGRRGTLSRLPGWSWAAAVCALTAAGALVLVQLRQAPNAEPRATRSLAPSASQARPLGATSSDGSPSLDEVDELASSFDLDDASAPDVLDDLALDPGDLADGEVDAWISAANATLGG